MKKINDKIKSEKGSITLFVLLSMLFFIGILLTTYVKNTETLITQEEDITTIKHIYEKDLNNIEEIYNKVQVNQTM